MIGIKSYINAFLLLTWIGFCTLLLVPSDLAYGSQEDTLLSNGQIFESEGYYYILQEDATVKITGFDFSHEQEYLKIPKSLNGYPVTAIGDNCFYNGGINYNRFRRIEVPETINSIGENAFPHYIYDLLTIIVPKGSCAAKYCEENRLSFLYREWLNAGKDGVKLSGYLGEYQNKCKWDPETYPIHMSLQLNEKDQLVNSQYYVVYKDYNLTKVYDTFQLYENNLACWYSQQQYDVFSPQVRDGCDVFSWVDGNLVDQATGEIWYRINYDVSYDRNTDSDSGFNEFKYRADYYLENSLAAFEPVMYDASPSQELYRVGKMNGLIDTAEQWRVLTFALESISDPTEFDDKVFSRKDLYTALIFSIFEEDNRKNVSGFFDSKAYRIMDSFTDFIDSTMQKSDYYKEYKKNKNNLPALPDEIRQKLEETTADWWDQFNGSLDKKGRELFSGIRDAFDIGDKLISVTELAEFVTNCYLLRNLNYANKEILLSLSKNCNASDSPQMKFALSECCSVMFMNDAAFYAFLRAKVQAFQFKMEMEEWVDDYWTTRKNALYKANPYAAAYEFAYAASTLLCNSLMQTDTVAEKSILLEMITEFENVLLKTYFEKKVKYMNSEDESDAEVLLSAIEIMFKVFDIDCEYAEKFVDTQKGTFIAQFEEQFQKTASDLISQIREIRRNVKSVRATVSTAWVGKLEYENLGLYEQYSNLIFTQISECRVRFLKLQPQKQWNEVSPELSVTYNGKKLAEYIDYYCVYEDNDQPGTANVTITGLGFFKGRMKLNYEIQSDGTILSEEYDPDAEPRLPKLSKSDMISISETVSGIKLTWSIVEHAEKYILYRSENGEKAKKINTSVKDFYIDKTVVNGNSYTYYAIASGSGFRKSSKGKDISIVYLDSPEEMNLSRSKAKKVSVSWKRNEKASGYQIRYAASASMASPKVMNIKKNTITEKKVGGLKQNQTYWFQIRAFLTADGKKHYSKWSEMKSILVG